VAPAGPAPTGGVVGFGAAGGALVDEAVGAGWQAAIKTPIALTAAPAPSRTTNWRRLRALGRLVRGIWRLPVFSECVYSYTSVN
jgi:hypothetical protein